jgi:hypothetical protein
VRAQDGRHRTGGFRDDGCVAVDAGRAIGDASHLDLVRIAPGQE